MKTIAKLIVPAALLLNGCITDPPVATNPISSSQALSQTQVSSSSSSSAIPFSSNAISVSTCYSNTNCDSTSYCYFVHDTLLVVDTLRGVVYPNCNTSELTYECATVTSPKQGVCLPKPSNCPIPFVYAPICANGKTYESTCFAQAAGESGPFTQGECNPIINTSIDTLNALLFDRSGGGNLHFYADLKNDSLRVLVTQYDFRATSIPLQFTLDSATRSCMKTALQTTPLIDPISVIVWDTIPVAASSNSTVKASSSSSGTPVVVITNPTPTIVTGTWFMIYNIRSGIRFVFQNSDDPSTCLSSIEPTVRNSLSLKGVSVQD